MRRLLDNRGETLVETLFAILILTLAGIGFAAMARTGVSISARAIDASEAIYDTAAEVTQRPGEVTLSAGTERAALKVTVTERAGITTFSLADDTPAAEGAVP